MVVQVEFLHFFLLVAQHQNAVAHDVILHANALKGWGIVLEEQHDVLVRGWGVVAEEQQEAHETHHHDGAADESYVNSGNKPKAEYPE